MRLTPLDPRRPARDLLEDLLEDLLAGIHGCWLLHNEYDDLDEADSDTAADAEERDDERAEQHQRAGRERFAQLVRETPAHHHDRVI